MLGGMDSMSARLDWILAWTISEAGMNRGEGARRGGRGLEESCWMYWDALEQAMWTSLDSWLVLWDVISVIWACLTEEGGRSKVMLEMNCSARDRAGSKSLGSVWHVVSEERAHLPVQTVCQWDWRYWRMFK